MKDLLDLSLDYEEEWNDRCSFFQEAAKNGRWYTNDGRILEINSMQFNHLSAIVHCIKSGKAEDRELCLPYILREMEGRTEWGEYWKRQRIKQKAKDVVKRKSKKDCLIY